MTKAIYTEPYRTHADGPLTTMSVEPGAVIVTMQFDVPGCHARLHSHTFDHTMEVVRGVVRIEIDGEVSIKRAGDTYVVAAHKQHSVTPLSLDAEVRCVHENPEVHPDRATTGIPLEWVMRLTEKGSYASS